jgi:hypothetical protein
MTIARILAPTDFTRTSDDALAYAEMLATGLLAGQVSGATCASRSSV